MGNNGFITLHRKFLEWQWFTDLNTCHLFLYCLLRANYKNTFWHGISIKKGQFVTSLRTISSDTGLSLQQIRTSLKKLTQGLTHELTHESHSQYSIITVKNYSQYQDINTRSNTQSNKQITTDNKKNNIVSIINSSSSSNLPKITEEEEEILKNHSLRNKIRYFQPWLRKILANGDYKEILEKERERMQRLETNKQVREEEEQAALNYTGCAPENSTAWVELGKKIKRR